MDPFWKAFTIGWLIGFGCAAFAIILAIVMISDDSKEDHEKEWDKVFHPEKKKENDHVG